LPNLKFVCYRLFVRNYKLCLKQTNPVHKNVFIMPCVHYNIMKKIPTVH